MEHTSFSTKAAATFRRRWRALLAIIGPCGVGDLAREFLRGRLMDLAASRLGVFGRWLVENPVSLLTIGVVLALLFLTWSVIHDEFFPSPSIIVDIDHRPYVRRPKFGWVILVVMTLAAGGVLSLYGTIKYLRITKNLTPTVAAGSGAGAVHTAGATPAPAGSLKLPASPTVRPTAPKRGTPAPTAAHLAPDGPEPGTVADGIRTIVVRAPTVKVVDETTVPVKGAQMLFIRHNGTHSATVVTGGDGTSDIHLMDEVVSVFCAREGFSAYYQASYDPRALLLVKLKRNQEGGSLIFTSGTGSIPGLSGVLNPILDTLGRTYLYAENIAVNDGKAQPVNFSIGRPMMLEDANGHIAQVSVMAIIAASSLIEYRDIR